jgi:hypothetical protein
MSWLEAALETAMIVLKMLFGFAEGMTLSSLFCLGISTGLICGQTLGL